MGRAEKHSLPKKKILFFTNTSLIGGVERNLLDLASCMDSARYEVYIAALERGGPLLQIASNKGIQTFDPAFSHYWKPGYLFRIWKFLRRERFDLILISGLKAKTVLLPLSAFAGIPIRVCTIVGLDTWKKKPHYWLEKLLNRFTTFWIANSQAAKNRAVECEEKPPERIYVIYQGLEVNSRSSPPHPEKNVSDLPKSSPQLFRIAYVANIREGKGHGFFLEALKTLIQKYPQIRVEFIGKDLSHGRILQLTHEYGLEKFVKFSGFQEDIRSYLHHGRFDLMILPSFSESFPTSLLEGMMEGIPVAASKVGGVPEMIEHGRTGWLFEPGNHAQLQEAIETLLKDSQLRTKLAGNAQTEARRRYDIHSVAKNYEYLFETFIENRHNELNPIKILRVQSRLVLGGPSIHTTTLCKYLNSDMYKSLLVGGGGGDWEKDVINRLEQEKVDYVIIPEMKREISPWNDFIAFIKLYRLIKKFKPHVVHTHTAKAGALGRLAAFLGRVPYIYHTFHGHVFDGYFGKFTTKMFIWLERLLASFSTGIVVISEQQQRDIVQKYRIAPDAKVSVIPLGFEWESFFHNQESTSLRERYKIPEDKFVIAIIGRIVPIKNHQLFVEVAHGVIKKLADKVHFVVIGDGESRTEVENLVKRKELERFFTFTGWLMVNGNLYKELDLVLLTSRNEGTPVVIIEALVSGTPVIASSVGGVPDVFKFYDKKHLISSFSPQPYVDCVLNCIRNSCTVHKDTSQKVRQYYSVARLLDDIKKLYEQKLNCS